MQTANDVDTLLKARAEIDEQLRRHKNAMTVLFTDVVGSTSFFERNGDTAGLVMIHRHDELAAAAIRQYNGKVIKTIGDSAMAEFPNPGAAVRAAVEIERQFLKLNLALPENQRAEVRIGVHTGVGFRKGNDLFGDVVNVTARIVKRTAPAQILISRATQEAISNESDLHCRWLSKFTIDGRTEKEDIFEVVWTDVEAYDSVQDRMAASSHIPPRYDVLSQIGAGGAGIVYKVRDLETGEIVALKILKPEIASDPDAQENFKRELCLARKITHKNVCRIYEFSRLNGTAYTSMELVEGESLSSRLYRVGSLPLNEALDVARQMCAGLREAHAQGIVHRDLKPANIMVDRSGTVKIMDFGIARMVQRDGPMTGTIVGTPAYMAPEQAELKPLSSCTDIYALGLVLYEMITGVAAFSGDTPVAVAIKQIQDYPPWARELKPELSRAIDMVIMKCLQKDPAKRFQSVDTLETALVKAAKAKPLSPWEAALNRGVARAEMEIRRHLHRIIENVAVLLDRDACIPPTKIREEPTAMLGVAGIAAALTVFLFVGGWKPRTINAETVKDANQNSLYSVSEQRESFSGPTMLSANNSLEPIASREVDLYADIKTDNSKSQTAAPATAAKPPRVVKSTAQVEQHKAQADSKNAQKAQALVSSEQPENIEPVDVSKISAQEPMANLVQPIPVAVPAVEQGGTTSQSKTVGAETKSLKLYLEVGTFKDETWATSAVDKLTQLGFHAVIIHKNLLWSQSYHVQVGPYTNQKDIAEARQSLAAQSFKAHVVN